MLPHPAQEFWHSFWKTGQGRKREVQAQRDKTSQVSSFGSGLSWGSQLQQLRIFDSSRTWTVHPNVSDSLSTRAAFNNNKNNKLRMFCLVTSFSLRGRGHDSWKCLCCCEIPVSLSLPPLQIVKPKTCPQWISLCFSTDATRGATASLAAWCLSKLSKAPQNHFLKIWFCISSPWPYLAFPIGPRGVCRHQPTQLFWGIHAAAAHHMDTIIV